MAFRCLPGVPSAATSAADPLVFALVLVATVQVMAMSLTTPATASIAADLSMSVGGVGATLTLFLALAAVGQSVFGPLSDLLGRRPVMVAGLAIFTAASLLCAVANDAETFTLGRALQAAGGAGFVVSRAVVRDAYPDDTVRVLAALATGVSLVPLAAPVIGGALVEAAGWRITFLLIALFGAAAMVVALRLPETRPSTLRGFNLARYRRDVVELTRLAPFWYAVGTLAALSTPFFALLAGAATLTEAFNCSAATSGLLVTITSVGFFLGTLGAGAAGRRGPGLAIVGGNVLALGAAFATAGAISAGADIMVVAGPVFLLGIGNGVAMPNGVGIALSLRPHLAGTAAGLVGTAQIGGGALASAAVGILADMPGWNGTAWPAIIPLVAGTALTLLLSLGFLPSPVRGLALRAIRP